MKLTIFGATGGPGQPLFRMALEAGHEVTAYVLTLSGRDADAGKAAAGQKHYATYCAACHGADGTGNTALGAPNLTDDIWLYGGSPGVIRQTIVEGRNGRMPAHRDFLGEDKSHLLATYVYSLSK